MNLFIREKYLQKIRVFTTMGNSRQFAMHRSPQQVANWLFSDYS